MKTNRNWRRLAWGIGLAAMLGLAFWMRALASWRPQKVTKVAPNDARALRISPDGRFLLVEFRVFYDLESGKWAPSVPPNEHFYEFAPDGTYFSARDDYRTHPIGDFETPDFPNRAKVFRRELATGRALWSALDSHLQKNNATRDIALSGDGKQVLVRGEENLKAFDARSGKMGWRHSFERARNGGFVRGGRFFWGSIGEQLFLGEVKTGRSRWRQENLDWLQSSGVSPDETILWRVSITQKKVQNRTAVRFYELKSGKLLWARPFDASQSGNPSSLTFSSDGRRVAFMNWTGVEWFDSRSGKRVASRRGPGRNLAIAMAFSHDDNWLYTSDKSGQIWKWRLK